VVRHVDVVSVRVSDLPSLVLPIFHCCIDSLEFTGMLEVHWRTALGMVGMGLNADGGGCCFLNEGYINAAFASINGHFVTRSW